MIAIEELRTVVAEAGPPRGTWHPPSEERRHSLPARARDNLLLPGQRLAASGTVAAMSFPKDENWIIEVAAGEA
jgi:hypothetical protein